MKIRYDAEGRILAVGDDGCEWQGRVLDIADRDAPGDLLATFALGKYVVREGKLAKTPERPPAAVPIEKLTGMTAVLIDPDVFKAGALMGARRAGSGVGVPTTKSETETKTESKSTSKIKTKTKTSKRARRKSSKSGSKPSAKKGGGGTGRTSRTDD